MDLHQSPKHFDFAIEKLNIRQYHSTCVFLMLNYKFLLHVLWMHNITCIYNYAFLSPGILNFSYSSSYAKRISESKYFHQNLYIRYKVWMVFDVICIYKHLFTILRYLNILYVWANQLFMQIKLDVIYITKIRLQWGKNRIRDWFKSIDLRPLHSPTSLFKQAV